MANQDIVKLTIILNSGKTVVCTVYIKVAEAFKVSWIKYKKTPTPENRIVNISKNSEQRLTEETLVDLNEVAVVQYFNGDLKSRFDGD